MSNSKHQVVKAEGPEDPDRCFASTKTGQCNNKRVPNGESCPMHGGGIIEKSAEKRKLRNYLLDKYKATLTRHSNSPQILSLRDEVGLSRMILEETLNSCHEPSDLLRESQRLIFLVQNIERLVLSCQKLEKSLGEHLSREDLISFTQNILGIISTEIDPERLDDVAQKILEAAGVTAD